MHFNINTSLVNHEIFRSLLFVLSVNSIEVGLLAGIIAQDVCNWEQWFLVKMIIIYLNILLIIQYLNILHY